MCWPCPVEGSLLLAVVAVLVADIRGMLAVVGLHGCVCDRQGLLLLPQGSGV